MNLTKHEQLDLIRRIENEVSNLGDYLYPEKDAHVNASITMLEASLAVLKNSFYDENTYIMLRDRDTGAIEVKYFEKGDIGAVCYKASQFYAWSDCDDTCEIVEIMCDGRKLEYVGWQQGMLFEYRDVESGEIVASAEHWEWDH
jgi:hypothetical protein